MKRLLAALFLALVVALVGASGVASADPPNDFTTGGGKVEETTAPETTSVEKFAFSAHDEDATGPTTGARNGHYVYERTITSPTSSTTVEVKGSVDCVWVQGRSAFFGGPIEKTNNPDLVGWFAYFDVTDNDQPPFNGTAPDQFGLAGFSSDTACILPLLESDVTSGNIVVHDAE
jgi:hypothetical protein